MMFIAPNHWCHDEKWLLPTVGECKPSDSQCLACLIDILGDINVSRVQREVVLGLFNTMVQGNNAVTDLLINNFQKSMAICNLIFDMYSKEPFKKTSVFLCVNLIHKLQNVKIFELLTERITGIICGNTSDVDLHFYLTLLHQLSERTPDFIRLLCFEQDSVLNNVVKNRDCYDQPTVVELACILKHVVKVILEHMLWHDETSSCLLQEIRDSLIGWLGSGTSNELHVASLALFSECAKSPTLINNLLLNEEREGSLLVMGLKRILALKQDSLILMGTQCLTKLVESISDSFQIKMILDNDLAELIFEFLHTSNVQQLHCVFECLQAMADHQLFFEKCHAVYGLETTLSAIQIAMDTKRSTIVAQGLSFLTCLLSRQPENMPLFLNQSWLTCASLLQDSLKREYQCMIHTALSTVEAFFREGHQQNLVDIKAISSIVKSVANASVNHFQMPGQDKEENMTVEALTCLFAIVNSLNKLLVSPDALCGNECSSLTALQSSMKSFCIGFLLQWTKARWHYFEDEDSVLRLFLFLDITANMTENDEELMQILQMDSFHKGLILLSQPLISKEVQDKGLGVLMFIFMKYAGSLRPSLHINEEVLATGFGNIQWCHASSLDFFIQNMTDQNQRGTVLIFVYLSLLNGYSISDAKSLLQFLRNVAQMCPFILTEDAYLVRSFVYILAVCQTNILESADDIVFEGSGIDVVSELNQLSVETWYTAGPAVFSWALLTSAKMETLGKQMVEYWLAHLNQLSSQLDFFVEDMMNQDKAIISAMVPNINFLQCLMGFLQSSHVGIKASSLLSHCIAQLSDLQTWEMAPTILKNLLSSGTKILNDLFIQNADVDCDLARNLFHVLCSLVKSPLYASFDCLPVSSFKIIYNVVKVINKCCDQGVTVGPALQFFSETVKSLSPQESQTIIPVLLQNDKCRNLVETTFERASSETFPHCLGIVVWLASNGQTYEAEQFVTVRTPVLLSYVVTCGRLCTLSVLQLLKFALCAMAERRTMSGACRFFKNSQGFIPSKVFSPSELKQIYGYLQQHVCQEDSSLRFEAMECIRKLIISGTNLDHFVLRHPWNLAMLETLSAKVKDGLQDFELTFYFLYSTQSSLPIWSSASATNVLIGLLNSALSPQQLDEAVALIQTIKDNQVTVDTGLIETVEACFQDCENW